MKNQHRTSIRSTFRVIQALAGMLLLFLLAQGLMVWRVCDSGSKSTRGLANEAIPSMTYVAALKEHVNLFRLRSYELLLAQEKDRPSKASEVESLQRQIFESIDKLKQLFPSGVGQQLLTQLDNDLRQYAASVGQLRQTMEKDFEGAMKILDQQIPPQVRQLNDTVATFSDHCNKLASGHIEQTVGSFKRIARTAFIFGSLSVLFAAIVAGIVTLNSRRLQLRLGELVRHLAESSKRVNESGHSVSSSSQSLAEGASEQAAALEETSASLEEMSSMTRRNADNSGRANQLARHTRDAAELGASNMKAMSHAMTDIKGSSDEIAKIIKTIDEIAFQTNILALNAAVEAARAGEAGMGFAVVADEVRNLAQRSAQAAKDTAGRIEDAINRIAQGADINSKVGDVLNDIVSKARQLDELVTEVATASKEQSHGISQVNAAVAQMDKITQSNASNAEVSAAAARELNTQAMAMEACVTELLQLVGATRAEESISHREEAGTGSSGPSRLTLNDPAKTAGTPRRPITIVFTNNPGETAKADDFRDF